MSSFSQQRVGAVSSLVVRATCMVFGVTLVSAASVHAANLDEVVVSATRTEQRLADAVADITVVDSEAIARSGQNSVAELLSRQPGMQITTNGGPATTTNVFIRGAGSQYTAVYLDGVRMESQTTSGGVTWQNIPLALIDRIEILRGPAAAVYGSDAMGGVILLFTKKGEGHWTPYVEAGYGTHGTYRAGAGMSGAAGAWDYSLSAQREGSEGFNSKTIATADPDKDGYRRTSLAANVGLQLNAAHRLQAQVLKSETKSDYDDGTKRNGAQYQREMETVGASWLARWSDVYRSTLSVNTSRDDYTLVPSNEKTKTRLNTYLWQNEFKVAKGQLLTASLERREDDFTNVKVSQGQQSRHQNALALGYGITLGAHTLQLNARHDKDSEFGGKSTGSAAYAWKFTPQWRASASVGTAFRVPTLYQRFSIYGDANLKPEESRNQELGLRWSEGDNYFSATAYRNRFTNMVSYVDYDKKKGPCGIAGCYENVDRAQLEGLTFAGAYRTGILKWHGSIDFQNPKKEAAEKAGKFEAAHMLERRSRRFATLGVDAAVHGWTLGAEMQTASRRYDKVTDKTMTLAGYTLFNLSASTKVAKDFTVFARLDNLMDKDYVLAKDYATAGRTLWVGLKWMPQ